MTPSSPPLYAPTRWRAFASRCAEDEPDLDVLYRHLDACGLSPCRLLRGRPVYFVDLVCSGSTFKCLSLVLERWCGSVGVPWDRVAPRVRCVCVLEGEGRRPDEPLERLLAPVATRLVRVGADLWVYLGEQQKKSTPSYDSRRWGGPVLARRPAPGHFEARRQSHELFELGASTRGRRRLVRRLARKPALRHRWYRLLVRELRRQVRRERRRRKLRHPPLFERFADLGAECS